MFERTPTQSQHGGRPTTPRGRMARLARKFPMHRVLTSSAFFWWLALIAAVLVIVFAGIALTVPSTELFDSYSKFLREIGP